MAQLDELVTILGNIKIEITKLPPPAPPVDLTGVITQAQEILAALQALTTQPAG